MNERIETFAKAAGYDTITKAYMKALGFDPEKFAELIVRECMTQIQEVREIKAGHASPEYNQAFDDGMFVAISTIEEHFGIE